jgi:hypothetical protein
MKLPQALFFGFLSAAVVSSGIQQTYRDFGLEICSSLPVNLSSDILVACKQAVNQEVKGGFWLILLVSWVVATAIFRLILEATSNKQ